MAIREKFKERILSKKGCSVILAGSGSDDEVKNGEKYSHIEKIANSLKKFGIPHEVRVCSAHKQTEKLTKIMREYNEINGSLTYIAVAGGTDALSGTLSFPALGLVISCPPDAPNQSCLTNPPGSSNVYIARPENVGKAVAQIYAGVNPKFREKLLKMNEAKISSLENADLNISHKYLSKQRLR